VGEGDQSLVGAASQADAWAAVVAELDSLGMGDRHGAIEGARRNGLTPTEVLVLVAEYREREAEFDGLGALHRRFVSGRWPVDEAKPNPDVRRHEYLATKTAELFAEGEQRSARVAEQRRELARLVEQHGPEIDALPAEEREKLMPPKLTRSGATHETWRDVFTVRSATKRI
jgi:hypothetical protein